MSPNPDPANDLVTKNLFAEATRQLNICNACRYCEGYCAVFPALERRTLLNKGYITHLANLCHDCRDCYYACMYSPPHPFGINPPLIFSEVRRETYDRELGRSVRHLPSQLQGWFGSVTAVIVTAAILVAIVAGTEGMHSLWAPHNGAVSPYSIIPYAAILVTALIPFLLSILLMARSAKRYWHDIQQGMKSKISLSALYRAISYAGDLRYLKGGGANCAYPNEEMSPARRHLHAATFYGFIALLFSTTSAGILQDLLGSDPPYRLLSVPVLLGASGGVSMVLGCTGLIRLKRRTDPAPSDPDMIIRDYGLLIGLDILGITGLLTLALRNTPTYGISLITHLAFVFIAFAVAPYSKFVHFIYRFLSILKENIDRDVSEV